MITNGGEKFDITSDEQEYVFSKERSCLMSATIIETQKQNEFPKISIIVPVYDVERYLERCVKSLINQTYKNIQIILVDDESPDKCPAMCDEFSKSDSRVEVVHRKNGGLSAARNSGIEYATGDYMLFVDSDDFIETDSCEQFVKILKDCKKDVDIVVGVAKKIQNEKITFLRHSNLKENHVYTASEYIYKSIYADEWYAPACFNLYNVKWFKLHGLKYTEGLYFEDLDLLPSVFLNAQSIIYSGYPFYNYCLRNNSIVTSSFSEKKKCDCFLIMERWFCMFSKVTDKKLKNTLFYWLSRNYLHLANHKKISTGKYPNGISFSFLICHCKNLTGLLKTLYFGFRSIMK